MTLEFVENGVECWSLTRLLPAAPSTSSTPLVHSPVIIRWIQMQIDPDTPFSVVFSEKSNWVNLCMLQAYSTVGNVGKVHDIMLRDSNEDPTTNSKALLAKVLIDKVDRKLVKQTVMTSVYGVTFVGAKEQIKRRLLEKGLKDNDKLLFDAACYAAKVTLDALGEIFEAARGIMNWLGDCAKVIASDKQAVQWTTPFGLPVVQPYCKTERHLVRTSLQFLALQREADAVIVCFPWLMSENKELHFLQILYIHRMVHT